MGSPSARSTRRRAGARSRRIIAGSTTTAFVGLAGLIAANDATGGVATVAASPELVPQSLPFVTADAPSTPPASSAAPPHLGVPAEPEADPSSAQATPRIVLEGLVIPTPTPGPTSTTPPAIPTRPPEPPPATIAPAEATPTAVQPTSTPPATEPTTAPASTPTTPTAPPTATPPPSPPPEPTPEPTSEPTPVPPPPTPTPLSGGS